MSDQRVRRWPMRLAKTSPLIAAAVLVALAISMPLPMPYSLLAVAYPAAIFADYEMFPADEAESYAGARASEEANLAAADFRDEPGMFAVAAARTWEAVNVDPRELISGDTIRRMPFAADDEVYAPIAEWEEANDATVWAWIVTPPPIPPVVASARGRSPILIEPQPVWEPGTAMSDTYEPIEPDITDDGKDSIAPWLWRELHTTDATFPALEAGMFMAFGGGGTGTESDTRLASTITADGMAWRCITVFTLDDPDDPTAWPTVPQGLLERDPRDAGYDEWLESYAREYEMDVWVFGPLESEAIPLRIPEGHDEAQAAKLGERLWPSWYIDHTSMLTRAAPAELDADSAALAGGPVGALLLMDWTQQSSTAYAPMGGVAAQSIAYLVVLDESALADPGPVRGAWYGWQSFAGRHVRPLLGVGYLFLLVSFVLSPAAFVADRTRRVRARGAEERERMHRDAHDKVYNRLSALSKRVATVSDTTTNGTAGSLSEIAEEIRSTVGELQEILGNDVEHTGSALASVSLRDQLAAVCNAQSARLGIEVVCDVPVTVHPVDPALGWDLQCIAEEAITNAVRHGGATRVVVKADDTRFGTLVMSVADNGAGSGVLAADSAPEGSTGLRGMQKRVARHGGTLTLDSSGSGTIITAIVRNIDSSASGEA